MPKVYQRSIPIDVNDLGKKSSYFLFQVRRLIREIRQEQPELEDYQLEDIGFSPGEHEILVRLYFYPKRSPFSPVTIRG